MHTAIIHAADAHAHLLDEIVTAAIAEVRARGLEVKAGSRQPARGRSELFIGAPGPVIPPPIAGPLGVDSPRQWCNQWTQRG